VARPLDPQAEDELNSDGSSETVFPESYLFG
jgi:hypothetical protein